MKFTTRDLTLIPIFTALMIVGAKVSIPLAAVPVTFQLFFAILAGLLLGARNGLTSQLLYVFMGLVGLPVFSYGGGFQYVFNPTFGYILGFAGCAFIVGALTQKISQMTFVKLTAIASVGFAFTYLFGNVYFYAIKNLYLASPIGLMDVFKIMMPYAIKDLILMLVAVSISVALLPRLRASKAIS